MTTLAQYWHDGIIPSHIESRQRFWDVFAARHIVFNSQTAQDFLLQHFDEDAVIGFQVCAVPAMASDYFRYHFLAIEGGVFIDSSFACGDPARFRELQRKDLFIPSVPSVDLTPVIVAGHAIMGRVLLNGVILAQPQASCYFRLLSGLVRRLVAQRIDESIPLVTGIGVLSAFDFALSTATPSGEVDRDRLDPVLALGSDSFRKTLLDFFDDTDIRQPALAPCDSADFREVSATFVRPDDDEARLKDAAHWSNHQGSIYHR